MSRLNMRKQIIVSSTSTGIARLRVFGERRTFVTHPVNPCDTNRRKGANEYCGATSQRKLERFQCKSSQKQQSFHQIVYNQKPLSPIFFSSHSFDGFHSTNNCTTTRNFSCNSSNFDSDAVTRNKLIVKLGRTGNWKELLTLYKDEGNQFTNANYATVITSLSRIRSFPKRHPVFDVFLEDIVQRLRRQPTRDDDVRGGIRWFGTRAISNIVHSLAKMNLKTSQAHLILLNFLQPANATWFVQAGDGRDVSNALWSIAKLQFHPNAKTSSSALVLFEQVEQHMDRIVMGGTNGDNDNNHNNNDVSTKNGNDNDERRAVRSAATPLQVANIVWAFATLGIQGPKVFELVDKYAVWLAHEGQPHHIARILWAFAKMNIHPPSLVQEIEKQSDILFLPPNNQAHNMKMRNNYDNNFHNASNVIWSFAKLGIQPSSKLMRNIEQVVVSSRHYDNNDGDGDERQQHSSSLSPQVMGNMAWSLATLGIYSSSIFLEIESNAQTLVHYGSPQAISSTSWAFATLKIHSPSLFEIIHRQCSASQLVKDGSTQAIANIAWAFASSGYGDTNGKGNTNGVALFRAIEDNAHKFVKNANVQEIIKLCYSIVLQEDGCNHYENALRPLWNQAMELATIAAKTSPKIQHQKARLTDYDLRQLILVEVFTMTNGLYLQKPSPQLRKLMESVEWTDVQNKSPKSISIELKNLGFPHEQDVSPIQVQQRGSNEDGIGSFFTIDLANKEKKVAIEYNGSQYFLRDIATGEVSRVEDGTTKAKRRFLENGGWDVISIHYQDWEEAEKHGRTKELLQTHLQNYL
mmetsp:Transcript_30194/g.46295  ORF Transcript_30194/g.46295 Transcript_30194/m.46295 type:complete len:805 (-) Transcript_30194:33-2447(-)